MTITEEIVTEAEATAEVTENLNDVEVVVTEEKKPIAGILAVAGLVTLPVAIIGCNIIKKAKAKKQAKEEIFDPETATDADKVVAYRDALAKANARIHELESQLAEDVEAETITEEE